MALAHSHSSREHRAGSCDQAPPAPHTRGELTGAWPAGQLYATQEPNMKVLESRVTPGSILGWPQDISKSMEFGNLQDICCFFYFDSLRQDESICRWTDS